MTGKNPYIAAKIHEYMQELENLKKFNGTILVAEKGDVLVRQGYGFANFEHQIPNTRDTKFRIGSITKQFTAAAIFILSNRNMLKLSEKISKHLSYINPEWDDVTIHQLLNHTAGIPDYTSYIDWDTTGRVNSPLEKVISLFKDKPLDFQPNSNFQYSNSGYALLGAVIEKVSGQSYDHFLEDNIFKPLNMLNSGYDRSEKLLPDRASGYQINDEIIMNAKYLDMGIPYSSGALYSTVDDLLLWDRSLHSGEILNRENLETMFTPTPLLTGCDCGYGCGSIISEKFNRKVIGHNGDIYGFASSYSHYVEDDLCIVVLSNLPQDLYPEEIDQNLAEIALSSGVRT